ncbi:MAG: sigma-54-dependent transcriptional regulator [Myxococcales bacterium]|jgi:two-component system response regulator AtoC
MERDVAVLVVDDDESSREFEREALAMAGYQVRTAANGNEALAMLAGGAFDAVLLDVRMPGMDGLELLESYRSSGGRVPMIVLSAMAGSDDIVKAMRLGATDYLTKPVDPSDLLASMARAFGRQPAPAPAPPPPPKAEAEEPAEERSFIAHSAAMLRVRRLVERIADTDVPVLLLGESGVGKEVIAREVHGRSRRRNKPFLKINCAALPSELLESELFGHEKGAFTGATAEKPGKFELAHQGTIFLDEIGEMDIRLQAKLLQVLQDEEFFRVGGKKSVRVDARVVCATNRDLEAEIRKASFREDLFYRLNVVTIRIPPLRERREDIPPIFEHFVRKYRRKYNTPDEPLAPDVTRAIFEYDFPGNVRELENLVRRLVVLRDPEGVLRELRARTEAREQPAVIGLPAQPPPPLSLPPSEAEELPLKEVSRRAAMLAERDAILAMLTKTAWNKRKAAARLQISYKALLYKIKECGIVDPRQLMSQP